MVPQQKMVGCKLATPWWGWMVCQLLQWVIRMSSACSKPCRWEILSSWKLCEDILCPLTLMILVWRQLVHTLWYSADHPLGQSLQYHVPLKITVQLILHFPLLLPPWLKDREQWTSGLQEQVFFQFLCYSLRPLLYRIQNDNKCRFILVAKWQQIHFVNERPHFILPFLDWERQKHITVLLVRYFIETFAWPLLQNQWIPHSLQPPILPHLFHVHQHRARSPVRHQRSLPFQSSKVPWGLDSQLLTAPTVKRLNRFLMRPAVKVCLRATYWWRSMGEWFAVVHTMMLLTYWRNVPEEKRHILSFRGEVSGFLSLNPSHASSTIGHFRVHFSLYFKRVYKQSLCFEYHFSFIFKLDLITITKISLLDLLWKRNCGSLKFLWEASACNYFFYHFVLPPSSPFFAINFNLALNNSKVLNEVWGNTMFQWVGTELNFALSLCGSIFDDMD